LYSTEYLYSTGIEVDSSRHRIMARAILQASESTLEVNSGEKWAYDSDCDLSRAGHNSSRGFNHGTLTG
jgi:hypothetical protein